MVFRITDTIVYKEMFYIRYTGGVQKQNFRQKEMKNILY